MNRTLTLLAVTAVASLAPAAAAQAQPVRELTLTNAHTLSAYPGTGAPVTGSAPATQGDGARTVLGVRGTSTANGHTWALVSAGQHTGWMSERATRPARPTTISGGVQAQLDSLLDQAGPASGAVVTDRAGTVLWSRRASTPRVLASNTKLFITGLYAHQAGQGSYSLLHAILPPSDNGLADALSVRLGGPLAAERYAASYGAHISIHDGSGLDPSDRAAPADVARYLVGEPADRGFGTWEGALPTAGVSGTLADRMAQTAAAGRCHAKTGTLPVQGVTALSGYCTSTSGHRFVFSILMNGVNITTGRALQDRMVALLAATVR